MAFRMERARRYRPSMKATLCFASPFTGNTRALRRELSEGVAPARRKELVYARSHNTTVP